MRIQNGYEFSTDVPSNEVPAKLSRFSRIRSAAREKQYYLPNIAVGTILATTALNMFAADTAEKQQAPQTPPTTSTTIDAAPVSLTETVSVAESGPSLRVAFADPNTNLNITPPESTQFDTFLQNVGSYIQNDPSAVVTFSINGSASDEDRSSSVNNDSNLGLPSASNEKLARDYADTAYRALGSSVAGSTNAEAFRVGDISSQEVLLSQSDQEVIEEIATQRSLSRYALLGAYNDQTIRLDGADALTLTTLIDDNRGATITTSVERTVAVPVEVAAESTAEVPVYAGSELAAETPHKFGFMPFAIPLRFRRRKTVDSSTNSLTTESVAVASVEPTVVVREHNPNAAAVPVVANYNQPAVPRRKPTTVEKMPPWLRRATRPVRHWYGDEKQDFYRKKSLRDANRHVRKSSRRHSAMYQDRKGIIESARKLKNDILRAVEPRM